jgi:hypothetical protein
MDATASLPSGTVMLLFTDIEGSTHLWAQQSAAMPLPPARYRSPDLRSSLP